MICPVCRSQRCRRSKRRGLKDHLLGLTGMRPWRCRTCDVRFYGWTVPLDFALYVHCRRCGNLDLQRIASSNVTNGAWVWLGRWLDWPAYRCPPCRHRFFSLRLYRRIPPSDYPPTPESSEETDATMPVPGDDASKTF